LAKVTGCILIFQATVSYDYALVELHQLLGHNTAPILIQNVSFLIAGQYITTMPITVG